MGTISRPPVGLVYETNHNQKRHTKEQKRRTGVKKTEDIKEKKRPTKEKRDLREGQGREDVRRKWDLLEQKRPTKEKRDLKRAKGL